QEPLHQRRVADLARRGGLLVLVVAGLGVGHREGGQRQTEQGRAEATNGHPGPPARPRPPGYTAWPPPEAGGRASIRPKIILPAGVWSTLVTVIVTSWPMHGRPCSTTTMVPSSRYPTPWPTWSPALTRRTLMTSPGRATDFSALASSLRL